MRDSGVVHSLLGIGDLDALLGHPVVGFSWEGFVIENLIAAAPDGTEACFYRTSGGAEVDLLLVLPGGERWAIEIKRTLQPKTSRGFVSACEDLQPTRRLFAFPGDDAFPMKANTRAIPIAALMEELTGLRDA